MRLREFFVGQNNYQKGETDKAEKHEEQINLVMEAFSEIVKEYTEKKDDSEEPYRQNPLL